MAGVRSKPRNGIYQGWILDRNGKRKYFTGTRKKAETRRIAEALEAKEDQIRLGYRKAPEQAKKSALRPFREVVNEYLAWGNSQGGRDGRPWGKTHAKERHNKLGWWQNRLKITCMGDLDGILPRVESALRELKDGGCRGNGITLSGKTLKNYAETLHSFCGWAVKRGYLSENPIRDISNFDDSPKTMRRAPSVDDIHRIIEVAPEHRKILYATAALTGLRAGELRSLTPECVDTELGVLYLDAAWTKNRKAAVQPIPKDLAVRLRDYGASGDAAKLYRNQYGRHDARLQEIPENPLLFVSTHPSRELDVDLKKAGIPKHMPGEGKLDFHCFRVAFITGVIEAGADVKEAQELARHSNPNLTLNIYARARRESLAAVVNKMAIGLDLGQERVICVSRRDTGNSASDSNSPSDNELEEKGNGGGGGIRSCCRTTIYN